MSWLVGAAEFELVMCPELLAEVREVLTTRPRLRRWITLEDAEQFVDAIETLADLVDDPVEIGVATRDRDDDYLSGQQQEQCDRRLDGEAGDVLLRA